MSDKAKTAIVTIAKEETYVRREYQIQCPHCKCFFQGHPFYREVIRIVCSRCKKPTILDWSEVDKKIKSEARA